MTGQHDLDVRLRPEAVVQQWWDLAFPIVRGQNSGPRFDAYDTTKVVANPVGTTTLTFADGNDATFGYKVMVAPLPGPVTQSKQITRFPFAATGGTVCQ